MALGAGESVIYPAANQFVSRWIPVAERGRAHGWIFAGVGAGSGVTPPLLTWINSNYGWRTSFVFCALLGVVAGAIWYAARAIGRRNIAGSVMRSKRISKRD